MYRRQKVFIGNLWSTIIAHTSGEQTINKGELMSLFVYDRYNINIGVFS
jgi:hypothetical protein